MYIYNNVVLRTSCRDGTARRASRLPQGDGSEGKQTPMVSGVEAISYELNAIITVQKIVYWHKELSLVLNSFIKCI